MKAVEKSKIVKKTGWIMARHEHTIMITDGAPMILTAMNGDLEIMLNLPL